MSAHRPPTSGLPTLTEVVEMPWAPAPQRAPQSEATVIAEAADPMLTEPTAALQEKPDGWDYQDLREGFAAMRRG